jgi:hypothetical protein
MIHAVSAAFSKGLLFINCPSYAVDVIWVFLDSEFRLVVSFLDLQNMPY